MVVSQPPATTPPGPPLDRKPMALGVMTGATLSTRTTLLAVGAVPGLIMFQRLSEVLTPVGMVKAEPTLEKLVGFTAGVPSGPVAPRTSEAKVTPVMELPPWNAAQVQLAPITMPVVAVPVIWPVLLVEEPPQPVDVKVRAVGTKVLKAMYWIEPPVWVPVN